MLFFLIFFAHHRSSVLIPKLYVFVGRFSDPADQVAHFALARFNESAFISLRFGGVMTPPYERQALGLTAYYSGVYNKYLFFEPPYAVHTGAFNNRFVE